MECSPADLRPNVPHRQQVCEAPPNKQIIVFSETRAICSLWRVATRQAWWLKCSCIKGMAPRWNCYRAFQPKAEARRVRIRGRWVSLNTEKQWRGQRSCWDTSCYGCCITCKSVKLRISWKEGGKKTTTTTTSAFRARTIQTTVLLQPVMRWVGLNSSINHHQNWLSHHDAINLVDSLLAGISPERLDILSWGNETELEENGKMLKMGISAPQARGHCPDIYHHRWSMCNNWWRKEENVGPWLKQKPAHFIHLCLTHPRHQEGLTLANLSDRMEGCELVHVAFITFFFFFSYAMQHSQNLILWNPHPRGVAENVQYSIIRFVLIL